MAERIQKLALAIPPLVTFALIEWGHISSIVVFYQNGIVQIVFISILYVLLLSSFIQLMRTNAGTVCREPLNTYTVRYDNGETRYCRQCDQLKPDRSHHCSICNTCVLRQDHHCPWIYNCVGYYTHKLFILFTFYGFLYCFVLFLTLINAYSVASRSLMDLRLELNTFMALVASGLFSVALFIFSALHISYALRNITSMDAMGFPRTRFSHRNDLNIFRKSYLENFKMFMGDDITYWWIPTVPKFHSDGHEYDLNEEAGRLLQTQTA